MSEFPGLDKWYLQRTETLQCTDAEMWQMLPSPTHKAPSNATVRCLIWNGKVVTIPGVDRSLTVADVIDRLAGGDEAVASAPVCECLAATPRGA